MMILCDWFTASNLGFMIEHLSAHIVVWVYVCTPFYTTDRIPFLPANVIYRVRVHSNGYPITHFEMLFIGSADKQNGATYMAAPN